MEKNNSNEDKIWESIFNESEEDVIADNAASTPVDNTSDEATVDKNDTETVDNNTQQNNTEDKNDTQDFGKKFNADYVEQWKKAKQNCKDIIKSFDNLQKDPLMQNEASKNGILQNAVKGAGLTLVGLSSIIGLFFKLLNFTMPGAEGYTGPLSSALRFVRPTGQFMIDKSTPVKRVNRVAPTGQTQNTILK